VVKRKCSAWSQKSAARGHQKVQHVVTKKCSAWSPKSEARVWYPGTFNERVARTAVASNPPPIILCPCCQGRVVFCRRCADDKISTLPLTAQSVPMLAGILNACTTNRCWRGAAFFGGHTLHFLLDKHMQHIHIIISLLKRWLLGTLQGAWNQDYLAYYLDEYTFRFNRRNSKSRGCFSTA
jgi:hypothetical protein